MGARHRTTSTVPCRPARSRWTSTRLASAAAIRRASAWSGSNRSRASRHSRSVSTTPTLCATGARCRSTCRRPSWWEGLGVVGDPGGPPPGQLTALDPAPDQRQPEPGLEHLPHIPPAGIASHRECGGEVDDRELRHARRTRAGQRESGVLAAHHHRRRVRLRHLVLGTPVNHQPQLANLLLDLPTARRAHGVQQGGVPAGPRLLRGGCHHPYPTSDPDIPVPADRGLWTAMSQARLCTTRGHHADGRAGISMVVSRLVANAPHTSTTVRQRGGEGPRLARAAA